MDLFDLGRLLHSLAGTVALIAFWAAALSLKGGPLHRRAGRAYLLALIVVMAMSTLMVAGKARAGEPGMAVYLAFLISMVGTAAWLTWSSTRYRREPDRLVGRAYRVLATWLLAAGAGIFFVGVRHERPLTMFLSSLGMGFGANMWRLALSSGRGPGFWRAHHLNGAMLNFIATHDSFLALGVGSVVPAMRLPVPRMMIAVGITALALAVRIALARKPRLVAPLQA